MLPHSPYKRYLAVLIWSLAVATLLVTPGDKVPDLEVWEWLDKPLHALLFAVQAGLLAYSLGAAMARRRALAAAAAVAGSYALLLEAVQIWVPGRSFDWRDVAADFAGIAVATLLFANSHGRLRRPS